MGARRTIGSLSAGSRPRASSPNRLWIDKVSGMSQAEIWLEVITNDTAAATAHLSDAGIVRCDEIEPLPEGSDGFWISSPAQIIHLVRTD